MEKIGNVGWFISDEEMNVVKEAMNILERVIRDIPEKNKDKEYAPNTTPPPSAPSTPFPWGPFYTPKTPCDPPYYIGDPGFYHPWEPCWYYSGTTTTTNTDFATNKAEDCNCTGGCKKCTK